MNKATQNEALGESPPKARFAHRTPEPLDDAPAFWTAPVLWRFRTPKPRENTQAHRKVAVSPRLLQHVLLCLACLSVTVCAAATNSPTPRPASPKPPTPARAGWKEFKEPGSFILSAVYDTSGSVWVGTEGEGIFHYDPAASEEKRWIKFTATNSGIGDNYAYSLCCDKLGRTWAGNLNHGVSVFNGAGWTNYDILQGPIGERVFKIACCPTDGDVWIATSAGLTRYSERRADIPVRSNTLSADSFENPPRPIAPDSAADKNAPTLSQWRYYTRADGLPSDQISAMAFDKKGNLWIGTQCDGIAFAKAEDNYKHWRTFPVLDEVRPVFASYGIPTKQVNDLLVSDEGKIFVATTSGLVFSDDEGKTWVFKRGVEYLDKFNAMTNLPPASKAAPKKAINPKEMMSEDYITCLAEDDTGLIWIGFRQQGFIAIDPYYWRQIFSGAPRQLNGADFIRCILPARDFSVFLGRYGGGLMQSRPVFGRRTLDTISHLPGTDFASMPPIPFSTSEGEEAGATNSSSSFSSSSSITNPSTQQSINPAPPPLLALPDKTAGRIDFSKLAPNGPIDLAPLDDVSRGKDVSMDFDLPELETTTNEMPAVAFADFPEPAQPPTLKELQAMLVELKAVPAADSNQPVVVTLEDDWRTEGQWLGRHGRFWCSLCANDAPKDYVWGAGWGVRYFASIGPNHAPGDSIRYWIQWLKTADNRCLEMAPTYLHSRVLKKLTTWQEDRRESEWDDHGEAYPMTMNGPHLYCSLSIPAGLFYLSLYDVNYNGHAYLERFRDYTVSIRQDPGQLPMGTNTDGRVLYSLRPNFAEFQNKPELAGARIYDFWGGAYKRFLVRGPAKLVFQVNRNYSFNTILAGLMLDLADELPPPYYSSREQWAYRGYQEAKKSEPDLADFVNAAGLDPGSQEGLAAIILHILHLRQRTDPGWWAINQHRVHLFLARWYLAQLQSDSAALARQLPSVPSLRAGEGMGKGGSPSNISPQLSTEPTRFSAPLARCYYNLGLYPEWETKLRELDIFTAREIEKSLRWDTKTYSMSGKGLSAVTRYLVDRAAGTLPTDADLAALFAASEIQKTNNAPARASTGPNTKRAGTKKATDRQTKGGKT